MGSEISGQEIWLFGVGHILKQTERFQVQGSRFKGYNRLALPAISVKIKAARHTPLVKRIYNHMKKRSLDTCCLGFFNPER